MKVINPLKAPFGKGKFSRLKTVGYHQWEDAFAVEFDDGLCFLEPHATIRRANKIAPTRLRPPPSSSAWNWTTNCATIFSSATTTARPPKSPGPSFANCLRRGKRDSFPPKHIFRFRISDSGTSNSPVFWQGSQVLNHLGDKLEFAIMQAHSRKRRALQVTAVECANRLMHQYRTRTEPKINLGDGIEWKGFEMPIIGILLRCITTTVYAPL